MQSLVWMMSSSTITTSMFEPASPLAVDPHRDLLVGLFREALTRPVGPGTLPAPEPAAVAPEATVGTSPTKQVSPPLVPPSVHADTLQLEPEEKSAPLSSDPFQAKPLQWQTEPELPAGLPPESPGAPDYYFLPTSFQPAKTEPGLSRQLHQPVPGFDLDAVRSDFPALRGRMHGQPLVYLDNAATTQKPQAVIDAISKFYQQDNAPVHRAGYELAERATRAFENARSKVAEFLGAKSKKEIVFTRGSTEAINLVAQTYGRKHIGQGDEIIVSELEHHANIVPWQMLAEQTGAVLKVIPINDRGELILEEYARLLSPRTKLVSVAHVSNSLGTINPIESIIPLAHAHGARVLIDGAQSTPHLPVNVQALDADFFVFSGHKIFGPTGVGALYGKHVLLESLPPWQGGGHMIKDVRFEKTVYQNAPEKFEAGTPNMAGAVGLGAAIDYLRHLGLPAISAYEHALLEYGTEQLRTIPGLRFIGTAANKASVLAFVLDGHSNESVAKHLDRRGIAVRAGHHCALPAVRHFGLESTVRPSLAFYNNRADVDALAEAIRSLIKS